MEELKTAIRQALHDAGDSLAAIQDLRELLASISPIKAHPVDLVRWVPIEKIEPNDYNPNAVATSEMGLLLHSIEADGYTQPIVTIYDAERNRYVVVDGFHRYFVALKNAAVRKSTLGMLPVVVIDKGINDRMASTVRHNRARGKHAIQGMSSMIFQMLDNGMNDAEICNELGMEAEELLRLKHITGFSKLFEDTDYKKAWVTKNQILARKKYQEQASLPGVDQTATGGG